MKTDLLAEKTALVMQNKKWRGCVMSGSLSTVHWGACPAPAPATAPLSGVSSPRAAPPLDKEFNGTIRI